MPLYDPERPVDVAPEDAVRIAHAFMTRCRDWAVDRELPMRLARVQASEDPADAASLHAWIAWRRFCEHAIAELEDGTLDGWFTPAGEP